MTLVSLADVAWYCAVTTASGPSCSTACNAPGAPDNAATPGHQSGDQRNIGGFGEEGVAAVMESIAACLTHILSDGSGATMPFSHEDKMKAWLSMADLFAGPLKTPLGQFPYADQVAGLSGATDLLSVPEAPALDVGATLAATLVCP
jgi:hypothetical protein